MIDWIAVLRAVAERLDPVCSRPGDDDAGVKAAIGLAAYAAWSELERQRDAAQGNGEEGRTCDGETSQGSTAAAADRRAPPPASSSADFARVVLDDRDEYRDDAAAWQSAFKERTAERDALRAQLAEREAELATLKSSERERLIRDVCIASDICGPIYAPANHLAAYERARRAKEKP